MVRKEDLMLGNWVECKSLPMQVVELTKKLVRCESDTDEARVSDSELKPIAITERLLRRCGFHKWQETEIGTSWSDGKGFGIVSFDTGKEVIVSFDRFSVRKIHELQNAYHMMTGRNLKIEL